MSSYCHSYPEENLGPFVIFYIYFLVIASQSSIHPYPSIYPYTYIQITFSRRESLLERDPSCLKEISSLIFRIYLIWLWSVLRSQVDQTVDIRFLCSTRYWFLDIFIVLLRLLVFFVFGIFVMDFLNELLVLINLISPLKSSVEKFTIIASFNTQ